MFDDFNTQEQIEDSSFEREMEQKYWYNMDDETDKNLPESDQFPFVEDDPNLRDDYYCDTCGSRTCLGDCDFCDFCGDTTCFGDCQEGGFTDDVDNFDEFEDVGYCLDCSADSWMDCQCADKYEELE